MRANYHNHTFRCGHAIGKEEEYLKRAIDAGLEIFGFPTTPHIYSQVITFPRAECVSRR